MENAVDLSSLALTVAHDMMPRKSQTVSLSTLASTYTIYRKEKHDNHALWASVRLPSNFVLCKLFLSASYSFSGLRRRSLDSAFDAFLGVQVYNALQEAITNYYQLDPTHSDTWTMKAVIMSADVPNVDLIGSDGKTWTQWKSIEPDEVSSYIS